MNSSGIDNWIGWLKIDNPVRSFQLLLLIACSYTLIIGITLWLHDHWLLLFYHHCLCHHNIVILLPCIISIYGACEVLYHHDHQCESVRAAFFNPNSHLANDQMHLLLLCVFVFAVLYFCPTFNPNSHLAKDHLIVVCVCPPLSRLPIFYIYLVNSTFYVLFAP